MLAKLIAVLVLLISTLLGGAALTDSAGSSTGDTQADVAVVDSRVSDAAPYDVAPFDRPAIGHPGSTDQGVTDQASDQASDQATDQAAEAALDAQIDLVIHLVASREFAQLDALPPFSVSLQTDQCGFVVSDRRTDYPGIAMQRYFDVPVEEVLGWFCAGFNYRDIVIGYTLARQYQVPVADVFALKLQGMTWEEVARYLESTTPGLEPPPVDGLTDG